MLLEREGWELIRAQNLYWLADKEFLSTIWGRISHLLPQEVSGGKLAGLNARFRGELLFLSSSSGADPLAQSTATFLERSTALTSTEPGLRRVSIPSPYVSLSLSHPLPNLFFCRASTSTIPPPKTPPNGPVSPSSYVPFSSPPHSPRPHDPLTPPCTVLPKRLLHKRLHNLLHPLDERRDPKRLPRQAHRGLCVGVPAWGYEGEFVA